MFDFLFYHMHEVMQKSEYDRFLALYFSEQIVYWQDDK